MVHIPTTERKYYDTQKKLSTLSAYAGALLPAAQNMQQMVKEQQDIKMDSLGVEARIKMNDATNEWRLANQSNPNNPEALKDLQSQYDSILSEYRGQIDPMYRSQWDIRGNKLKGAFDLENQTWGFKQRQENAKNDIAKSVDNFYKLAFSYGQSGDINKALADFQVSYDKLLDYGAKNLGTEDAAMLLKDYQEKFALNYLNGVADNNPQRALYELENNKVLKEAIGQDSAGIAKKLINKQIQTYNFNRKASEFNNQLSLDDKLNQMNPVDALRELETYKGAVSSKWYKAKERSLMYQSGIDAETRAETASDIALDISAISAEDAKDFFKQSNDVLTKIEEEYAAGRLSFQDKKNLTNNLKKRQGKNLPSLIDEESGWYMPYDYSDAKDDIDKSLVSVGDTNKAMLEYIRTIGEKDYTAKERKSLVKSLIKKYNNADMGLMSFQTEEEARQAYKSGKIKKGDYIYINGIKGRI